MAKKDATLPAKKSGDYSMVRIRLLGHFDIMSEDRSGTGSAPTFVIFSNLGPLGGRSSRGRAGAGIVRDDAYNLTLERAACRVVSVFVPSASMSSALAAGSGLCRLLLNAGFSPVSQSLAQSRGGLH